MLSVLTLVSGNLAWSVGVSPDGELLAIPASGAGASPFQALELWDVRTGREVWEVPQKKVGSASQMVFSADGSVLATTWRSELTPWRVKPFATPPSCPARAPRVDNDRARRGS